MIYAWFGGLLWASTSFIVLRFVGEPFLYRRAIRRRLRTPDVVASPNSEVAAPLQGGVVPARASARSTPGSAAPTKPAWRRFFAHEGGVVLSEHEVLAAALDAMGRELRLGSSLHAAVVTALSRHPITALDWLTDSAQRGDALGMIIRERLSATASDQGVTYALRGIAAAADGGDPVHAVESAARTLRTTAGIIADSRAAVAQTRTSINVLTWVPLLIAAWLMLRDASVRSFFGSVAGAFCLMVGILLNWAGRRIVRRVTHHAIRVDSVVPDFVDVVSIHLRSGKPPALAFLQASDTATGAMAQPVDAVIAAQSRGERFIDALIASRQQFPLRAQPLLDALIDTERDGLSPRELFERLAGEAHAQRRRDAEQRIRALPVRLTLPLVGCVLPAYVLLAVVPLLAGQLTSVTLDPPPLMKGLP